MRLLSRFASAEIIAAALAPTVRKVSVLAHVRPILFRREESPDAMIDTAADLLQARGIVAEGDRVVSSPVSRWGLPVAPTS